MTADHALRAAIHFPIEGRSPWVQILRIVALGSVGTMAAVSAMLLATNAHGDMTLVIGGLAAFLLLEYFIIRALVVPRLADYGRFRLYQNKVDFFPLDMTGLSVKDDSDSEPITAFAGIAVQADTERAHFKVMLLHREEKGRTICLKTYTAPEPANSHAEALAQTMGIKYAPYKLAKKVA